MLQLNDVCKSYTTADFTQTALDHVSLAFRDNEFVAILGPSGSGKTTMLNIIGGLDHYDSGDLLIDGISTKEYKDRDWDTYRNNRIGFVFQSYNLIPHQTILENVELALTLSGVSRSERRTRATEALQRVGLGDHVNKKPSQLSGGQMQRVAIARALVNDPEIVLADEPTGALDSKTSVQIMDLLTEIANDRLVIMVTHNPELAEQYATRTVTLADGVIRSDTDPFDPSQSAVPMRQAKPSRSTSMSLATALSLSFKNLLTKKGRTIMTAFAGSIGIIGIAAILALANGVNAYIANVEENTLSEYPLTISSQGLDITSLMTAGMDTSDTGLGTSSDSSDSSTSQVKETRIVSNMFNNIGNNDLASLKEYFDNGDSNIEQYTTSIEYTYNVTPQIFDDDTSKGARQVNPDKSFSSVGLGTSSTGSSSLMSSIMSTDTFHELPENTSMFEGQYDVKAGHWPENYNEVVVVLSSNGSVSDFMLYTMGLRDSTELTEMVKAFANSEDVKVSNDTMDLSYDDLLNVEFKLVYATDYYQYDEQYGVWKDKSDDSEYMKKLVNNGETLKVVGVVQPKPDAQITSLTMGISYSSSLVNHIIDKASESKIVQEQKANPSKNVISGKSFADEENESKSNGSFDMSSLFTIDGDAITSAFKFDTSALTSGLSDIDLSGIDMSNISIDASSLPEFDASSISIDPSQIDLSGLDIDMSGLDIDMSKAMKPEVLQQGMASVLMGYPSWYAQQPEGTYTGLDDPMALATYMSSAEVQTILGQAIAGAFDSEYLSTEIQQQIEAQLTTVVSEQLMPAITNAISEQLQTQLASAMSTYMNTAMTQVLEQFSNAISTQMSAAMEQYMSQLAENMANAMSIDETAFANAFKSNMTEQDLSELMSSLMTSSSSSYDNNMKSFGWADYAKPSGISIYPKDFECKQSVIDILDGYNDRMKQAGEDGKVVTYTDVVGALMSSVTTIVNMISAVLVAFVAISLVVSSIMIGIITYISVLERKKEIGILRSIGASKGDVGRVFNAETLIVGFAAGVIGIGITWLLCIPANIIIAQFYNVNNVALLPLLPALVLVVISMVLTFVAGLIPSSAASRKDPVEALRSE